MKPDNIFWSLTGYSNRLIDFSEGELRGVDDVNYAVTKSQKTAAWIRCQAGDGHVTLKYVTVMLISMLLATRDWPTLFERPSTNIEWSQNQPVLL